MHDEDLDQILRVIDTPGPVPDEFRSELLDDLREAFDAREDDNPQQLRPILRDDSDDKSGEVYDLSAVIAPAGEVTGGRSLGPRLLLVAAAVTILIAGLVFLRPDTSSPLDVTDDPAAVTSTALAVLSIQDACTEFVESTAALSEVLGVEDQDDLRVELEAWLGAIDRLLDRSPPELADEHLNVLLQTRVLVRQAIDTAAPSTVLALDAFWRDNTAAGPLSACRR